MEPFPQGDHVYEGQELEPARRPGEQAWSEGESSGPLTDSDDDALPPGPPGDGAIASGGTGPGTSTELVALSGPTEGGVAPQVPVSGVSPGCMRDAIRNYEATLALAQRSDSGVDKTAVNFIQMKLHNVRRTWHNMQGREGSVATALEMTERFQAQRRALSTLQAKVAAQDEEQRVAKRKARGKKEKKSKKDKAEKKHKKDKKSGKSKKTSKKHGKGKKDGDSSSDSSKGRMQVLSHMLPADDSMSRALATGLARKSQKVGSALPSSLAPAVPALSGGSASMAEASVVPVPSGAVAPPSALVAAPGASSASSSVVSASALPPSSSAAKKPPKSWAPPLPLFEQADRLAGKALLKDFSVGDFGQGHVKGGSVEHRRNRLESLCRLLRQSEARGHFLLANAQASFGRWCVRFEASFVSRTYPLGAIGVDWSKWIKMWRGRMQQEPEAFKAWLLRELGRLPPADVQV